MPTALISLILKIGATLLSIFSKSYEAHNNPGMVLSAAEQLHQDLKDKEREIDALLAKSNASAAEHAEALKNLRLAHS